MKLKVELILSARKQAHNERQKSIHAPSGARLFAGVNQRLRHIFCNESDTGLGFGTAYFFLCSYHGCDLGFLCVGKESEKGDSAIRFSLSCLVTYYFPHVVPISLSGMAAASARKQSHNERQKQTHDSSGACLYAGADKHLHRVFHRDLFTYNSSHSFDIANFVLSPRGICNRA